MSIRNHAFGYLPAGDTLKTCAGDHAGHPGRVPGPAAAARPPPPRSSRVMTRPAPPRPGQRRLTSAPRPPGSAPSPPPLPWHPVIAAWPGTPGVSCTAERTRQWPRPRRSRPGSRQPQPARQPGRPPRWPGAQAVAVQAAASLTLAALLWPLIPAAGASRLAAVHTPGQRQPLRPLPGPSRPWSCPGPGRRRTGRDVPGGPPGTVPRPCAITPGGRGGVGAPGPVHRRGLRLLPPELVRMLGGRSQGCSRN